MQSGMLQRLKASHGSGALLVATVNFPTRTATQETKPKSTRCGLCVCVCERVWLGLAAWSRLPRTPSPWAWADPFSRSLALPLSKDQGPSGPEGHCVTMLSSTQFKFAWGAGPFRVQTCSIRETHGLMPYVSVFDVRTLVQRV